MCLGAEARAQNEAARRQYKYQLERREREWMQELSIYDTKVTQFEINTDNARLAAANAYTENELKRQQARDDAQLKYRDLYLQLLEQSPSSKLIASGRTGQSIRKMQVSDIAKYGRSVSEIGRDLLQNDYALRQETAKARAQSESYIKQSFAEVAFQPIEDVAPPQPVMRSVGAAAFMDALSIGSSVASMVGAFSDRRLKENIKKIGKSISGLGIYTFNYLGQATKYVGTMADEVLKVKPEAVSIRDGYMAVRYDLIDVDLVEVLV